MFEIVLYCFWSQWLYDEREKACCKSYDKMPFTVSWKLCHLFLKVLSGLLYKIECWFCCKTIVILINTYTYNDYRQLILDCPWLLQLSGQTEIDWKIECSFWEDSNRVLVQNVAGLYLWIDCIIIQSVSRWLYIWQAHCNINKIKHLYQIKLVNIEK